MTTRGPVIAAAQRLSLFLKCLVVLTALFLVADAKAAAGSDDGNKGAVGPCQVSSARKLQQFQYASGPPPPGDDDDYGKVKVDNLFGDLHRQCDEGGDMNRISGECSKDDVVINQGQSEPLPDGVPTYTVQILNVCVSGCNISDIHVSCSWFSSTRLVNPMVFRRIYYDDCLVNDGNAMGPGESLSFVYSNSFPYPLSVSAVSC